MKWIVLLGAAVLTCAPGAPAQGIKPAAPSTGKVASFETDTDNPFVLRGNIAGSRVTEHATDGRYALRVVAKGSEQPSWPALWLYPTAQPNWSARQLLVMDLFVETLESVEFGAQICLEGRTNAVTVSLGRLQPGWNKSRTLSLEDFGVDLSRVANLALYLARPRKDVVYTIDNVRWETLPAPVATNGWLNVRDFGASGSKFETVATTTAGSNQITVADVGDFQAGQEVSVSRCNIRYLRATRYGPGEPYATARPVGDGLEMRGYDGSGGSWLAYIVEVDGASPVTFRWKGDLAQPWAALKVPVSFDWQPLSGGTEIRFKRQEWKPGEMVTFSARDQLVCTIEKIEGRVITLSEAVNRTAKDAVVRHTDRAAIQKTIDMALRRKCNVFFPSGHYRIPGGLRVTNARALCLEGAGAETTVLDISDGEGSCFGLTGGTEVTIRNFTMAGHTGLAEAPRSFTTTSGYGFWPNGLKGCNAVGMSGTERVLIENVHARRMASECFYAQGPARAGQQEPRQYQKSLTYLRCSVTDCAANAFNNNDRAENTSILYCRVDGAGWHAAEMPARFLRVEGCYFRNTGAVTVGDMSHRYEDLHELGCGQAMVRDNVFEGIGRCGGIAVNHGSSQVVISGNLFINFNGPAITVSSQTVRPSLPWFKTNAPLDWGSFPSRSAVISGNIIDLTYSGTNAADRVGISVDASEVTIADNQIYVRGQCDPRVTGIRLREPALHLNVHDNLIRNCGTGLAAGRVSSRVTQVIDATAFLESSLPLEWRHSHQYQGWNVVWLQGRQTIGTSVIESYDPATLRFKLKSPRDLKVGDTFEVFPPHSANWLIHDNTITGCQRPVVLDSHGSDTSLFRDNLIERGGAANAAQAIAVTGRFKLLGNHTAGFDQAEAPLKSEPVDYKCLFNHELLIICGQKKNRPEYIASFIEKLKDTDVDAVMCCPTMWRANLFPSQVDPTWKKYSPEQPLSKFPSYDYIMRYLHGGGDPVKETLEACRKCGKAFFISYRMNDHHYVTDLDWPSHNAIWREHPEYWLGDSETSPYTRKDNVRLFNYLRPEVRDYYFAILQELCTNYDVDGVELDFQRFPKFFPSDKLAEGAQVMTELVRRIKAMMDRIGRERGKSLKLCVRVPETPAKCAAAGLDVPGWDAAGLVEMINISSFYNHTMELDIEGFLAKRKHARLYGEMNYLTHQDAKNKFARRYTTFEIYRASALNLFHRGVDGLSLFNYDYVPEKQRLAMAGGLKRITDVASLKTFPKNYVVYSGFGTFPATNEKTVEVIIPDNTTEVRFERAVLRVETRQSCADLRIGVWLNGKPLAPCEQAGTELFPPLAQNEGYAAREALKFYAVPLELLVCGRNRVEIKNLDRKKASCQFRSLEIAIYR